jgi:3-oxoacyl-[acyl-carrier protein] reductase
MTSARYDFHGRTALVTGGAGGIGAAVARTLQGGGAQVATLDVRARDGGGVLAIEGDVRRSADVEAAVARVEDELGALDIAVCAAGVSGDSLATVDVGDEEWRRVFSINCDGVFFTNRAAARVMVPRGYGRIVNVASIAGKEGNPMAAAYSASKAAVIAMTKSIGKDLAETGVLVNCVAPAVIETRMLEDVSQEHIDYMVERIPMKRLGQPEEVARLIAFLASDACSFSTGGGLRPVRRARHLLTVCEGVPGREPERPEVAGRA